LVLFLPFIVSSFIWIFAYHLVMVSNIAGDVIIFFLNSEELSRKVLLTYYWNTIFSFRFLG